MGISRLIICGLVWVIPNQYLPWKALIHKNPGATLVYIRDNIGKELRCKIQGNQVRHVDLDSDQFCIDENAEIISASSTMTRIIG